MNLPLRQPKKKLQTTTARRSREADYFDEPNVKLSSAFVVVLVLHVVAVGGIYAFNAIKAHQPAGYEETAPVPAQPPVAAQTAANPPAAEQPTAAPAPPLKYHVKSGDTLVKIASTYGVSADDIISLNNITSPIYVGEELKLPTGATAPAAPAAATQDSGVTYTVVRGDTLVSIARRFHVAFDGLMRLNRIEDPKRLKIGEKLKIPPRHPAAAA